MCHLAELLTLSRQAGVPDLPHNLLHLRQAHQRDVLRVLVPARQGHPVAVEQQQRRPQHRDHRRGRRGRGGAEGVGAADRGADAEP